MHVPDIRAPADVSTRTRAGTFGRRCIILFGRHRARTRGGPWSIRKHQTHQVAPVSARNWTENDELPQPTLALRMRIVRTVANVRAALVCARRGGETIGLVPTMGALHDGHLSLIRRARRECDVVVVSLFVNPTQFDERADLARYPRNEHRDAELAAGAGAGILFAPDADEVYPAAFATSVEVRGLTDRLEGAVRGAEHFRGVCTVVAKLLGMTQPDVAYFGQKDAQQLVVIRRMVVDLDLPVRIQACPTVRERDGLAMSSRNARLSAEQRARAVALSEALDSATRAVSAGERSSAALLELARAALDERSVEPEYVELVDPDTLAPCEALEHDALLLIAARVGATRLIDNTLLRPSHAHQTNGHARPTDSCSAVQPDPRKALA
jgi:pantoate--beta-alanine ligase